MQKTAPLWLLGLALWSGAALAAVPTGPIIPQAQGAAPIVATTPAPNEAATAIPNRPAAPVQGSPARAGLPKVVLMLPTASKTLGEAATVVQEGFLAAARTDDALSVTLLSSDDGEAAQRYREAVADGARVVVGPLTRGAIAAVAPEVSVPTLALNAFDPGIPANPKLLSLSLAIEGEARQLAQLMREDGRRQPAVLVARDALSRRLAQAFAAEWQRLGGRAPLSLELDAEESAIAGRIGGADALLLAAGAEAAARWRGQLSAALPVYGASPLNLRRDQPALAGARVIDMPWFLMPDHPAVKRYPRPDARLTQQTERLYALGVDAYRLAVKLAARPATPGLALDGVTGDLRLGRDRQFERRLPVTVLEGAAP
ncbi:penicillin-binding protein activator [Crenobacter luteus]|uniref:Penicillin-binding protein activator n=1 Tax=Crenobacter luteus TaxID=1452487 RepID=A0A163D0C1_9NEIS|nr:penicillin-binding protein activator [Crenobacter luteus]KZE33577.1 hypothetical protein AVW16_08555 [Crenobacter luteus]